MDAFSLLDRFLADWDSAERAREVVAATVACVARSAAVVSDLVSQGPLAGTVAAVVGTNTDGDVQKELDVRANRLFVAALRGDAPVAVVGLDEERAAVVLNEAAPLAVAIDLLDGVPLVFGSRDKVESVARYHTARPSSGEESPLFGRRGPFLA